MTSQCVIPPGMNPAVMLSRTLLLLWEGEPVDRPTLLLELVDFEIDPEFRQIGIDAFNRLTSRNG